MLIKIATILLSLTPVAAVNAENSTHTAVAMPAGKTVNLFRPVTQRAAATAPCHPHAEKAIACNARNHRITQSQVEGAASRTGLPH